jgi:hypothetical protein
LLECQRTARKGASLPNEHSIREKVSQAFGNWIDGMASWEWYATLTFRDPQDPRFPNWTKIGWKSAHNALQSFNNALVMELDYINPAWVAAMELQQRGVPHWHLLVANVEQQRRMSWVDWWYEHYGIARILPYQAELGARYYLGKYLTKEIADIRFSPLLKAKLSRIKGIDKIPHTV